MKMKGIKKLTAVFVASALIASGTSTAFAAETYQEYEKEAMSSLITALTEASGEEIAEEAAAAKDLHGELILKAEPAGLSLLSLMTGMDFSWLDNITLGIDSKAAVTGEIQPAVLELLLNDTSLLSINAWIDNANMYEYLQVPELSESIWGVSLASVEDMPVSAESMTAALESIIAAGENVPDEETITTLIDRYWNLLVDGFQEAKAIEETVSIGGIEEACTVYEGLLYEKDAMAMAEKVLVTAKDDAELKTLLEFVALTDPEYEDLYEEFQVEVDDLLEELQSSDMEEAESGEYISSRIWVNAEDEIVGREVAFTDGVTDEMAFTWQNPHQDDSSALLVELYADGSTFTIAGTEQMAEGILNGEYILAVDYQAMANIAMEYDSAAAETGVTDVSFEITFPQPESEDDMYDMNSLAAFGFLLDITGTEEDAAVALTVTSGGAPLASFTFKVNPETDIELTETPNFDDAYDVESEEDIMAYVNEMNYEAVLENAVSAGVPEELVSMLQMYIEEALYGTADMESVA